MGVTVGQFAEDITRLTEAGAMLTFQCHAVTAFQIVALLQLALRHPEVQGLNREAGTEVVEDFRSWFADMGAAHIVVAIDEGSDPAHDVPSKPLIVIP